MSSKKTSIKHNWKRWIGATWKLFLTLEIRTLLNRAASVISGLFFATEETDYEEWRKKWVELNTYDKTKIENKIKDIKKEISFEILIDVQNVHEISYLDKTIKSLVEQYFSHWNVRLFSKEPIDEQIESFVQNIKDQRIRLSTEVSSGSNTWIIKVQSGNLLHEAALFVLANEITNNQDLELLYTDNDHVDVNGKFFDPYMKPDWNPDLLSGINYFSELTVIKNRLWKEFFSESKDSHEIVKNITRSLSVDQIKHVPHVLGSILVQDNDSHLNPTTTKIKYPLPQPAPLVSILIPTKNKGKMLEKCITSLISLTSYPNFEIIIIDHESTEAKAKKFLESLKQDHRIRILNFSGEFNFSAIANLGSKSAKGEVFVLLNNDTEIFSPHWLDVLVRQVSRKEIGVAGSLLFFPTGTIQHAGIHPGVDGLMGHGHKHFPKDSVGYFGRLLVTHDVASVTGACLAIEKDTWLKVGGLDEEFLKVAYNDVDLCLKVRDLGLRVVLAPDSKLIHHESASRGLDKDLSKNKRLMEEVKTMKSRWGDKLDFDPAYSPNLCLDGGGFKLSDKPRINLPWRDSLKNK